MLRTPLSAPATRSLVCQPARGPVRPNGVSETCTSAGLAMLMSAWSTPSSPRRPGGCVSMTRSARSASRRYAACPSAVARSASIQRVPPSSHHSSSAAAPADVGVAHRRTGRQPADAGDGRTALRQHLAGEASRGICQVDDPQALQWSVRRGAHRSPLRPRESGSAVRARMAGRAPTRSPSPRRASPRAPRGAGRGRRRRGATPAARSPDAGGDQVELPRRAVRVVGALDDAAPAR